MTVALVSVLPCFVSSFFLTFFEVDSASFSTPLPRPSRVESHPTGEMDAAPLLSRLGPCGWMAGLRYGEGGASRRGRREWTNPRPRPSANVIAAPFFQPPQPDPPTVHHSDDADRQTEGGRGTRRGREGRGGTGERERGWKGAATKGLEIRPPLASRNRRGGLWATTRSLPARSSPCAPPSHRCCICPRGACALCA